MIEIYREHDIPLKLNLDSLNYNHFENTSFHRCLLNDFDFTSSYFKNIDFRSAEMNNCVFLCSVFDESKLIMVESVKSNYEQSYFKNTLLFHSKFVESSFICSDLSMVQINDVDFLKCDLRGANMSCVELETCNFEKSIFDDTTIWHSSFDPIKKGAIKI